MRLFHKGSREEDIESAPRVQKQLVGVSQLCTSIVW